MALLRPSRSLLSVGLRLGLVACSAGFSCSPGSSGSGVSPLVTTGGAYGAGGSIVGNGGGGSGGVGNGGQPGTGPIIVVDGGNGDGGSTDAGCAAVTQEPEQVTVTQTVEVPEPVTLYLMQDRSSSMVGICALGDVCNPNGWKEASTAISNFANDPASAGINVGIGFFPPMTGGGQCNGSDCGTPVVAPKALPGNAAAVVQAMKAATPTGILYTPTECALRGMIDFCKAEKARTGINCVPILVTDGEPTRCDQNISNLAKISAAGYAAGIRSFTLGMTGSNFTTLNQLAQAGGSDCDPNGPNSACDVQSGEAAFLAALNAIRKTVSVTHTETHVTKLDCQWKIPAPPSGEAFDPTKVNFQLSTKTVSSRAIGYVANASACATVQDGWYYDDAIHPTVVHVCPTTCTEVQTADTPRVDIVFGCARQDAVPR